jgi:hypothetical protein
MGNENANGHESPWVHEHWPDPQIIDTTELPELHPGGEPVTPEMVEDTNEFPTDDSGENGNDG